MGNWGLSCNALLLQMFTNMFFEKSSSNHADFVQMTDFDWLSYSAIDHQVLTKLLVMLLQPNVCYVCRKSPLNFCIIF